VWLFGGPGGPPATGQPGEPAGGRHLQEPRRRPRPHPVIDLEDGPAVSALIDWGPYLTKATAPRYVGVHVQVVCITGMLHGSFVLDKIVPDAAETYYRTVGSFLAQAFGTAAQAVAVTAE